MSIVYNCMQFSSIFHPWRLATLALAVSGAFLFDLLSLPLPLLLGPMFACLIAALAGMPMKGTPRTSNAMRVVLGVAVGASLTPALFGRLDEMALSVALVPIFTAIIVLVGYPYFRRLGFDHPTAYYCSVPGGLQDMAIFGEEAGGNVRALALVHATRVLVIVSLMPVLLTLIWGLELTGPPGDPVADVPIHELLLMAVCGLVGWWIAARIGMFGGAILGPMIVTGIAAMTDFLHFRPPAEVMQFAQFFLGLGIGVKYAGITAEELRRYVAASIGYCLLLAVLSVIFAEIVIQTGLAAPLEALMAFAPGGQAEMVLLAIIAGADMAYVVTHHLTRVVLVITCAPIAARLLDRSAK
ncbi:MAG: AbrB family transcriptional regulator [Pseudomonadota bacterium]